MKKAAFLLMMVAAAGQLAAQEFDLPPGKWWQNPRVAEQIGLTDEQQERIRDVVYEHARRMIDLKADVDRSGLDLKEAVDRDEFEPDAVRTAYGLFQDARHKLENERFEMLLAVRQVLTNEQWKGLQEIRRRFQEQRGQRRPGQRGQGGQMPPQGQRPPG